jgi:hypothetical protein
VRDCQEFLYLCTLNKGEDLMSRSKEEAIAAGIQIRETMHSMKRRKPWHDYYAKGQKTLKCAEFELLL